VPKEEYSGLPIKVLKFSGFSISTEQKVFIDMINKKVIEGEKVIADYQTQIEIPPE
jgi:hypothetical protein